MHVGHELFLWLLWEAGALPHAESPLRGPCMAPWTLAGLGHCEGDVHADVHFQPLRTWFPASLTTCIRSCEDAGRSCAYASFKDDNLFNREDERTGLCLLAGHCPVLRATSFGAATFTRRNVLHTPEHGGPRRPGRDWVTLAPAEPYCSPRCSSTRLCATSETVTVAETCNSLMDGLFRLHSVAETSTLLSLEIVTSDELLLCGRGGAVHAAATCQTSWELVYDFPADGETEEIWLPCAQLRYAGRFLAVSFDGSLVLQETSSSCWAVGFEQRRLKDQLLHRLPEVYDVNMHDHCGEVPSLWVQASPAFHYMLQEFLSTLQHAGDPVRVCVQWMHDMKDVSRQGFHMVQGASFVDFQFQKLMLQIESELVASLAPATQQTVIFSDLDVVVFGGWVNALLECVTGQSAADVCFTQRGGFGTSKQQLVNSGVYAARMGNGASIACLLAVAARLQNQDLVGAVRTNQQILNFVLRDVARALKTSKATKPLQWGIYNPLLAFSGFAVTSTVLGIRLQHVTGSTVSSKDKLRMMDAAVLLRHDLEQLCPLYTVRGRVAFIGPLSIYCYPLLAVDPHFGHVVQPFKVLQGFGGEDLELLMEALQTASRFWFNQWSVLLDRFNGEGGYRHYRQARRNSSRYICAQMFGRSCQR
ncbi:unnamed protein product [Symbiodinium sp. CCMP2592]|nr:unnamed protein product [Symbiodinium sp. CCMP2592]